MTVFTYRKRGKHGTSQDSRSPTRVTCVKCFPYRYDVAGCLGAVGENLQMLRVAASIANQAQCTADNKVWRADRRSTAPYCSPTILSDVMKSRTRRESFNRLFKT